MNAMEKDKFEYEIPALEPMTEKVTAVQGATGVDPDPDPGEIVYRADMTGWAARLRMKRSRAVFF